MDSTNATSMSLLGAVRNREDESAWRRFDERYRPRIRTWCRKLGASEHDADDIAQAVMLRLTDKIEQYDSSKGRFRSWLAKIANNCWHDLLRERGRHLPQNLQEVSEEFGEVIVRQHDYEVLELAQARIESRVSVTNWKAFRLVTFDELSAEDVASQLKTTKTAVYQAAFRIRKMLKAEIEAIEENIK